MNDSQAGRPTLWVSGGGSGIGRAIALSAARRGYNVAVSGRRPGPLAETADLIEREGGVALSVPLDVRSGPEIHEAHSRVEQALGPVSHLVCGAGLNAKERFWQDQSMTEFDQIVQTNLTGAARLIDAALPGMRLRGSGVVVIVSSTAGWSDLPHAGVAYAASKTALAVLASTLNAQEGGAGIRSCHLCPGDTATDFLQLRPLMPDREQQQRMLTAEDVARSVQFVLDSPPHVTIDELVISPASLKRA